MRPTLTDSFSLCLLVIVKMTNQIAVKSGESVEIPEEHLLLECFVAGVFCCWSVFFISGAQKLREKDWKKLEELIGIILFSN